MNLPFNHQLPTEESLSLLRSSSADELRYLAKKSTYNQTSMIMQYYQKIQYYLSPTNERILTLIKRILTDTDDKRKVFPIQIIFSYMGRSKIEEDKFVYEASVYDQYCRQDEYNIYQLRICLNYETGIGTNDFYSFFSSIINELVKNLFIGFKYDKNTHFKGGRDDEWILQYDVFLHSGFGTTLNDIQQELLTQLKSASGNDTLEGKIYLDEDIEEGEEDA